MRYSRSVFLLAFLGLWPLSSAQCQTVTFDFDTGAPTLSPGMSLPFDQASGGVTAHFSAPSLATFSVQSDATTGWKMSRFSGNYLYQNSLNQGVLDIRFSQLVTSVSLTFATADFHQIEVPSTVQVTAFLDSTAAAPVGSATAHGTYAGDTMPMGILAFTSSRPFNLVEISIPYQPLSSGVLLVDNVAVTLAFHSVSAATFQLDTPLAPGSIASAFGQNLAAGTASANTLPLPTMLAGVTVIVKDSAAKELPAPVFFVSPGQINYLVPEASALGPAAIAVSRQGTVVASAMVQLDAVSPGLFSADASGTGVAAAVAVTNTPNGAQTSQLTFQCPPGGSCVPVPVDLGGAGSDVVLILFGTGIRGASANPAVTAAIGGIAAELLFAGPQGGYAGLDQVNVRVPRVLAGHGDTAISVTVDGKPSNTVSVVFR